MDKYAILTGMRLMKKADLDWLAYENQTGEWGIARVEAFERHLRRLERGFRPPSEPLWYGWPERGLSR